MDKYVGKRLDGRYEIEEIIGVGGMAVVYKAYDNVQDRTVAIKILKDEYVSNEEFIRRFKNESKAIAILSHPNIVKVYDVSFGDLIQYIVMEYIDGITLKEHIERQGSLLWKDAVYYTIQILKALGHAHDKGIVHRDVKPQNIMVLSDGTIKVTDFGIARFARNEQRTMTDKAIGSVHYISPEQARGEKTDEKADIYSVGVMLYEMLTGQLPFDADSAVSVAIMQLQKDPKLPTQINSSIPLGLEQITMKAMQKNPDRRYQAASEMLCDLEAFKKDPAITFDHYYFVDTEPTKSITIADDELPKQEKPVPQEKKSNMIPILSGVASALVVALIILAVIFVPKLFKGTGAEIECPNFVGKTKEEIVSSKDAETFSINWDYVSSDKYEMGVVCEQSQPKGKKVKTGAKITLYVSMGQATVTVPDVYNKSESYAVSELKAKGLTAVIKETPSDTVDKGLVIKTDPERTTVVAEKAEVTVYVSSGKETKMTKVPDVVGSTKEQAESDLKKAGFIPVSQTRDLTSDDKYYKAGYVISQSPAPSGEKLAEGTTVNLYISSGVYQYNVTVRGLKTSYENVSYGELMIYADGVEIAHKSVNLEELSGNKYSFTTSSESKSLDVSVKFSFENPETGKKATYEITSSRITPSTTTINCP